MYYRYRSGMQASESEVIRQLRRRGYAVAVIAPRDVGPPVHRVAIEEAMLKVGKTAARKEKPCSGS